MAAGCEILGADLLANTDWDHGTVAVELAASDWRAAIEWGESLFFQKPPAPAAVTGERRRRIARHELAGRNAAAQADRWWHRLTYPRSRFGHPLEGTEESLVRIEHCHVEALAEDRLQTPLWFVAVGCVPREQLIDRLAESVLSSRRKALAMLPPEPCGETRGGTYQLEMPTAGGQAEIRVGQASVCRNHAAFAGLQLLTQILGARLDDVLRDRSGASYRASVRLLPGTGSSPLIIAATVESARAGEALERIAVEVERLCEEPIPEAELAGAKAVFEIDFLRSLQSLPGLAAKLKRLAVNEHSIDHYQNHLHRVRILSARDLQALAGQHIRRERFFEVVAGPPVSLSPWRTAVVPLHPKAVGSTSSSEGEYR
jgi:zinc protease